MALGAALCNDARRTSEGETRGDPTEVALMEAAEAAGMAKVDLETAHPRVAEIPFDSDRKMMTTVHRDAGENGGFLVFSKGAVEAVLERSKSVMLPGGDRPLDHQLR